MTDPSPQADSRDDAGDEVQVRLAMTIADTRIEVTLHVPAAAVGLEEMLPPMQALTDLIVQTAAQASGRCGQGVSCRDHCGVCCRQLVPLSQVEARYICRLIEGLPSPRRGQIQQRLEDSRCRLAQDGFLEELAGWDGLDRERRYALAARYFELGIPCVFLEDESCSIYPGRPLVCREFLVTTPPDHCRRPTPQGVQRVTLPGRLSRALYRLSENPSHQVAWVPMVLATQWADRHPGDLPRRTGPQWIQQILELSK